MKDYVLHFIQTYNLVDKNISSFWRCSADNYNHAVEQLRDEIERNQGERLLLVEYYKSWVSRQRVQTPTAFRTCLQTAAQPISSK